ncbi:hypothetical protein O3P69_008444 [Scylla paramamosain]|uniref:EGF-like domain-containing protein n=1 Tax=Scylla paramamosain TaxID=85552 RepID=A0AAW0SJV9_SCYPA
MFSSAACDTGRYGAGCAMNYSCTNDAECDISSACMCQPGWLGTFCSWPCPEGYWGPECRHQCGCGTGATCDPATGACLCPPDKYGLHCSKDKSFSFSRFLRMSVRHLCVCPPGSTGIMCQDRCPDETYSFGCQHSCPCQHGGTCQHDTGACLCPPGLHVRAPVSWMTTANMATAAALPRAHVSVPQAGVATFVTSHVIKVSGEKSARREYRCPAGFNGDKFQFDVSCAGEHPVCSQSGGAVLQALTSGRAKWRVSTASTGCADAVQVSSQVPQHMSADSTSVLPSPGFIAV